MRNWFLIALIIIPGYLLAQTEEIDIEKIVNTNSLLADDNLSDEEINAMMIDVLSEELDLNTVSEDILTGLQFLTIDQVSNFIDFRKLNGPFMSIWELQLIEGWDLETCLAVKKIARVDYHKKVNWKKEIGSNPELLVRHSRILQEKNGYSDSIGFHGSPNKWQIRAKTSSSGLYSASIAFENDPGEKFEFKNDKGGFDHISGNLSLFNRKFLKVLVLGDYRVQFGQGLINGGSFGGRKSSEPIMAIRKSSRGIIPSAAFGEFGYKRGIAFTASSKNLSFTSYVSWLKQDAKLHFDSLRSVHYFTSFNNSGLHRTGSDLSSRGKIITREAGANFSIQNKTLSMGLQFNTGSFSIPMQPGQDPYQNFRFEGRSYHAEGLYLSFNWQSLCFFHETVISNFNAIGTLSGLIAAVTKGVDFSILYRYYSPRFYSPGGNSFAESSTLNNESGLYLGLKYQLYSKWVASIYFDYFKFPWLKFGNHSSSDGHEYSVRIDYISKQVPFYILLRRENKYVGPKIGDTEVDNFTRRTNLTLEGRFNLNENVTTGIRPAAAFTGAGQNLNAGFLLRQDLKIESGKSNLTFGYFLFETSGSDTRLYSREPDVRYQSTFPLFSGKGIRYFVLVKLKLQKRINLWVKYYLTSYSDREEIGSGDDLISGNKISEIRTQLMYSLR